MKQFRPVKTIQRGLSVIVWRYLPPCKDVVQMVSDSLDNPPGLRKRIVMKVHILACRACERYLKQTRFLGTAANEMGKNVPGTNVSAKLSSDAKDRLKNALKSSASLYTLIFIF